MNKKVLGSAPLTKQKMSLYFIVGFIPMLLMGLLIALCDKDSPIYGIIIILIGTLLLIFPIFLKQLPDDCLLLDEENKQLIIYGTKSLFNLKKAITIKLEDITNIGYRENGTIGKRQPNDGLFIYTHQKMFKITLLDSYKNVFNNIEKILPDTFYLYKFIEEKNIDKILTFENEFFLRGLFEILDSEKLYKNFSDDKFKIYIFLYFLICLYNGALHYFMTYCKKYYNTIIEMYKKMGLTESSEELQKLYYIYPKTTGKEYFEDLFEKFKDPEEVEIGNNKLNEVGSVLLENDKDSRTIKAIKQYILDNNINLK